mgnify:CR=1 FL=1
MRDDVLRGLVPAAGLAAEPEDLELAIESIAQLTERLARIPLDDAIAPSLGA